MNVTDFQKEIFQIKVNLEIFEKMKTAWSILYDSVSQPFLGHDKHLKKKMDDSSKISKIQCMEIPN